MERTKLQDAVSKKVNTGQVLDAIGMILVEVLNVLDELNAKVK